MPNLNNRRHKPNGGSGHNRNRFRGNRNNHRADSRSHTTLKQNYPSFSANTDPHYPFRNILLEKFSDKLTEILENPENLKGLEVEFRLGKMYYRDSKLAFSPNLPYDTFIKIVQLLNSDKDYWDSINEKFFTEYNDRDIRVRFEGEKISELLSKKRVFDFTANLKRPYFDVRLSISKENDKPEVTAQQLVAIKNARPPITKTRTTFTKDFVEVVLTTYKSQSKTIRQVEVEINLAKTQSNRPKFVVFAAVEYLALLMTAR